MKINNYNNNINFGIKLDTGKVLEVTSLKIFQSDGLEGCKEVINALKEGRRRGCHCVGLSGRDGGEMNDWCEPNIVIPSQNTPRIQEMHILIIHYICQKIDEAFKC